MAMTKCKECGEKVSTSAKKCPHCGVDYPGTSAGDVIGGLVVLALIVGAVWWFMSDGDKEEAKSYSYSSASYEEVDSILCCLFEKKLSIEETVKNTLIEKSIVEKIYELNINSEHKRLPAQKPNSE